MLVHDFKPIVDRNTQTLILGTLPGPESLRKGEYYGHPRNHFWTIMMTLLKGDVKWPYDKRIKWVLKHGIGLWDTFGSGWRPTSADADIKDAKYNDFNWLFATYPKIHRVFCNSQTSYKNFTKGFPHLNCTVVYLPSTSPACARPLEWKLKFWKQIISDSDI